GFALSTLIAAVAQGSPCRARLRDFKFGESELVDKYSLINDVERIFYSPSADQLVYGPDQVFRNERRFRNRKFLRFARLQLENPTTVTTSHDLAHRERD